VAADPNQANPILAVGCALRASQRWAALRIVKEKPLLLTGRASYLNLGRCRQRREDKLNEGVQSLINRLLI